MDTGQASYEEASTPGGPPAYDSLFNEDGKAIKKEEEERKTVNRIYLKECICSHTIWHDCRFWEQTLWHCVTEQVDCFCTCHMCRMFFPQFRICFTYTYLYSCKTSLLWRMHGMI